MSQSPVSPYLDAAPLTQRAGKPSRFGLQTATALLCASLLGCAAPAWLEDETAQTTAITASLEELSLQPWWQVFHDTLLQQLIEQSLQTNTSVESARAALRQARATRAVEIATQRPQLSMSGALQRNRTQDGSSVGASAGFDASWELDIFGANRSALANRSAEVVAAQTHLRDVQLSMSAEVALAYLQLRTLQSQREVAQRNLASQQETLQITRWRAQAGLLTMLEVEQAVSATAQTAAQLPALDASLAKTRHSLAVLTGKNPTELDPLLSPTQAVPQAPPQVADVIDANRLRQRADLRAAEARIEAALASVDAAQAARYPSFRLGGSLGLSALTLAGLGQGASVATTVLASMSATLFDGGAGAARVQVQQVAVQQAQASYQAALLTALQDVEDAMVAWQQGQPRITQLQQAALSADHAAQLARQRYDSGLVDFQTVLQTQRTQLSTQDSLVTAQADQSANYVRLIKAMGGAWL